MIKLRTKALGLILATTLLSAITGCGNSVSNADSSAVATTTTVTDTIGNTTQTTTQASATQASTMQVSLQQSEAATENGATCESAVAFFNNMTAGWNIGNTLDSFGTWITDTSVKGYETAWGNPQITPELIAYVKSLGFNTIRVPVTYAQHMDSNGNIDKTWLNRVKEVVDYCMEENLHCIINIHHDTGAGDVVWLRADEGMYNSGMSNKYVKVWQQIAGFFKDYDERLIFEGFNEILDISSNWGGSNDSAYSVVNKLNQLFVDTVRASGGNNGTRNLIVNAYGASNYDSQIDGFTLPKDNVSNHLLASVHIYSPQNFCDGNDATFDEQDEKEIVEAFERVHNKLQRKYNIPVIVGECGVANKLKTTQFSGEIAKYYACMTQNAAKYGMTIICWDNGGDMGLIDRKNLSMTEPQAITAIFNVLKTR